MTNETQDKSETINQNVKEGTQSSPPLQQKVISNASLLSVK
ncbi:hypothetical protein [Candidatus Epulonipiscium viviparus]